MNSKFYAQSGEFRWVLLSPSLEAAALRFTQLVFKDAVRGKQTITEDLKLIIESEFEKQACKLGEKILISESGFDGEKTGIYQTSDVVKRWRKQVENVQAMLRKMA